MLLELIQESMATIVHIPYINTYPQIIKFFHGIYNNKKKRKEDKNPYFSMELYYEIKDKSPLFI